MVGAVINGVVYRDTSIPSGIKQFSSEIPTEFKLYQNYPNPFNPSTKIKFDIPSPLYKRNTGEIVSLKIFNLLGQEIATLVNRQLQACTYEVVWNADNYPSGVYFCRITTEVFTETKAMLLIK